MVDLPGVNAQERTKESLLDSLRVGAEDMLEAEVPFVSGATMTTVHVRAPSWIGGVA